MIKQLVTTWTVGLAVLLSYSATQAEDKIELKDAKCPVSGKAAKDVEGSSLEHNGGKVFFCCSGCPDAYKNDKAKFAAKANQQLFVTGQAKQVKCMFTGKDCNPEAKIEVDGKAVNFCCNNCKGKAEKADDKVALIFNDTAFAKGFKVGGKK